MAANPIMHISPLFTGLMVRGFQNANKKEVAQRALDTSQASDGDFDNFLNTFFSNNIFVQSSIILDVLRNILNDMGEKDRYFSGEKL